MRTRRIDWDGADPVALAADLRSAPPRPREIAPQVAAIVDRVREGGEDALCELAERHDGVRVPALAIDPERIRELAAGAPEDLRVALGAAAANVRAVAQAQVGGEPVLVEPGQGQRVRVSEVPVRSAAIYVPGGRAPYPSTVLMGVIAARAAGVERVVVASPPTGEGVPDPAVLVAAEIAGADLVHPLGGAHAIAALAHGTESIEPVDVIAGPGGPWVQEAKLAVSREVGIDGYAGPSELLALSDGSAPAEWIALDLCAQAEHGADGMIAAVAWGEERLDRLVSALDPLAREPSVFDAEVALIAAPGADAALALAEAIAPEHLQLCCADAERLAERVRTAGCVLTGPYGATAFGDYAAGSNHVLPTGGSGRFSGPLGPATFRRRISVVGMSRGAAVELGSVVETIAAAEGFPLHGRSALARAGADAAPNGGG